MYFVVKCIDFDKSQSVIQTFQSRRDAEEFAWFRRRDETDDRVRYVVTDYFLKASPIVEGVLLRYSVGFYRGRHRTVIAWFQDFDEAMDFLERSRRDRPYLKYDLCQSLF